jgi:hypothetical protein
MIATGWIPRSFVDAPVVGVDLFNHYIERGTGSRRDSGTFFGTRDVATQFTGAGGLTHAGRAIMIVFIDYHHRGCSCCARYAPGTRRCRSL